MIAVVPVAADGDVSGGWGRAPRVAVATVQDGRVVGWQEHDVRWDLAHDEGSEGAHHARVARFLREHAVDVVVTGHLGAGMQRMLGTLGIRVVRDARGNAREAVLAAAG